MRVKPDQRADRIRVLLANEQSTHKVDENQLTEAVRAIIRDSIYASATISLAIVDDPTMHELNRRHLGHDYPTDVLSFVLEDAGAHLEGEVIINGDVAAAEAEARRLPAAAEQLLYAIHGTLHLVGYGDKLPNEIDAMRAAEAKYMRQCGFASATASSVGETPRKTCSDAALDRGKTGR